MAVQDARRRTREIEAEDEAPHRDRPSLGARGISIRPRTGGLVSRIPVVRNIVAYFRGVASEMRKVTWPTREEATRLTAVVLGVTAAFAIGLGILDAFFSWWFRQAFHPDSEWIFLVVAAFVAVIVGGAYVSLRNRI